MTDHIDSNIEQNKEVLIEDNSVYCDDLMLSWEELIDENNQVFKWLANNDDSIFMLMDIDD